LRGAAGGRPAAERVAGAEFVLDEDLKRQLDERTHQYRMGDDPR
jgi:hypothetical protein